MRRPDQAARSGQMSNRRPDPGRKFGPAVVVAHNTKFALGSVACVQVQPFAVAAAIVAANPAIAVGAKTSQPFRTASRFGMVRACRGVRSAFRRLAYSSTLRPLVNARRGLSPCGLGDLPGHRGAPGRLQAAGGPFPWRGVCGAGLTPRAPASRPPPGGKATASSSPQTTRRRSS